MALHSKHTKSANVTTDVFVQFCEEPNYNTVDICEIVPNDEIDDRAGNQGICLSEAMKRGNLLC